MLTKGSGSNTDISKAVHMGRLTVEQVRKQFVEKSLTPAINPKARARRRPHKLAGEAEALLIATACSSSPYGYGDWTLQLLANKLVECEIVDSIRRKCFVRR